MDPVADPISMIVSGGGGLGGGAVGGYLLSKVIGNKGDNGDGLKVLAAKLDHTNELLNELLRSHARLEGIFSNK